MGEYNFFFQTSIFTTKKPSETVYSGPFFKEALADIATPNTDLWDCCYL